MLRSAVASHRCFWFEFFQWSTRPQRCSAWALTDSSTLVVLSERPTLAKRPSRCRSPRSRLNGGLVQLVELGPDLLQFAVRLLVVGPLVGALQPLAPPAARSSAAR
jgi:hypothetical protein